MLTHFYDWIHRAALSLVRFNIKLLRRTWVVGGCQCKRRRGMMHHCSPTVHRVHIRVEKAFTRNKEEKQQQQRGRTTYNRRSIKMRPCVGGGCRKALLFPFPLRKLNIGRHIATSWSLSFPIDKSICFEFPRQVTTGIKPSLKERKLVKINKKISASHHCPRRRPRPLGQPHRKRYTVTDLTRKISA